MDKELLDRFKAFLIKKDNIVFAYVFGSFVSGTQTKDSDVDFAVYLSKVDIDAAEYLGMKVELMDIAKRDVDIVILNSANPLVKNEIFGSGVRLFSKDEELESDFIVKSLFEYEDMKKYYKLSYDTMIERLRKEVSDNG
ncbi:hypothetical protein EAL2_c10290 [Peptoclostridium acidaminophilum DSM 3953]|uniref:Polymerase beta nucleotidyltransferase domain-containing protein n=1 Tax=Peptoclostridium acidaminophilum DSM 3953 TaxID=1286171 RepID=W8TJD5_PEPAC|nr:nucleotidyltransferase domain-containing protein [Peptoclostridium acidaminophilum]AHM56327.1 hypothetical protein EAL2_c10290 [Peptoclostridium acidaminophilum DSM 3953]